ncbi:MAG: lysophospholipid acyltransferase family protein [Gammaproteobacteria bacterium]|nr:lysophospholipid acyltransferase family protein [Gammaproteobacteria bacterium]
MKEETELLLAKLLRYFPVSWTSGIGAYLGEQDVLREASDNLPWVNLFYQSIEQLTGVSDSSEKRKLLIEFGRQMGRVYAEFTILQKIDKKGLITINGLENLNNRTRPCLIVLPHLANWELATKVATLADNPTCILYEPRESEQKMAIANQSRLNWGDNIRLLSSAEPMVMKKIVTMLKNNINVCVLPDEEKSGFVNTPSLGRKIPNTGNLWMVSRLAAKHSLDVIPMYVERVKSVNFIIHVDEKISPQKALSQKQNAEAIADKIDELFNQWVRQCPQHWFWMPYLDLNKKALS